MTGGQNEVDQLAALRYNIVKNGMHFLPLYQVERGGAHKLRPVLLGRINIGKGLMHDEKSEQIDYAVLLN